MDKKKIHVGFLLANGTVMYVYLFLTDNESEHRNG